MNFYPLHYAYRSKFAPERLFGSVAEARGYDCGYAAEQLGELGAERIAAAFDRRDQGLIELLKFALDELGDALPALEVEAA
jgi:hypothetical protein